ncbi:MAG: hypothetical protein OEX81_02080 [Candidatus Pacebacteria bacterium]|nr:hypothetical protein [Candidatus Paceibacterota bacterium]
MVSIKKKFFQNIDLVFIAILFIGWLFVVLTNYRLGTWLSGWDNLHPEFNFPLNIGRSLSAVWQEYQGLGLLGGMSHSADLSRQLVMWSWSIFLPSSLIRYAWHFLMLLIGPIGAYFFSKKFVKTPVASFIAGFFYLFNLATVQYFYVPYESFSSFYGFLPWLLWAVINYLDNKDSKSLLKLFVMSVLATSAFYVQTLFVVYLSLVMVFVIADFLSNKKDGFKSAFSLLLVIFIANSFWLLPSLFFTVFNSSVTTGAKQNLISTPEVKYMNLEKGGFENIFLLKGYWFDYIDSIGGKSVYLFESWRQYFSNQFVITFGYLLFSLSTIGFVTYLRDKKASWKYPLLTLFLLQIIVLTAGKGYFGVLFNFASNYLPLFGQMFRTVFTKWSVAFVLFYGVGLSLLTDFILQSTKKVSKLLTTILFFIFSTLIVSQVLPIFSGELISKSMTTKFPQVYGKVTEFFKEKNPQARIAYLPAHSVWGWNNYDWDYRGSGFLWYGIEQPILDRAFDVWSDNNETFYFELADTLASKDDLAFSNLINKYHVKYLLIDESVVIPGKDKSVLRLEDLKSTFTKLSYQVVWQEDFITVIDTGIEDGFVTAPDNYSLIGTKQVRSRRDDIFSDVGNYVYAKEKNVSQYPFVEINSESFANVVVDKDLLYIKSTLERKADSGSVTIPGLAKDDYYNLPITVKYLDGVVSLESKEQIVLKLSGDEYFLPVLQDLNIATKLYPTDVILDINGQLIDLKRGQTVKLHIDKLSIGKEIRLRVFDKLLAKKVGNDYLVDQTNVTKKNYPSNVWEDLQKPISIDLNKSVKDILLQIPIVPENVNLAAESNFRNCDIFDQGNVEKRILEDQVLFIANDKASACQGFWLEKVSTRKSHIISFDYENISGKSQKYYFENLESKQSELENVFTKEKRQFINLISWPTLLDSQYSLNLETRSFGDLSSIDQLEDISIYQLPYSSQWFSKIKIGKELEKVKNYAQVSLEKKVGTFYYLINVKSNNEDDLIVLNQAHHFGWVAYSLDNNKYLNHYLINNWANSWMTNGLSGKVVIFYWPQLLEFLGLFSLVSTFIILSLVSMTKQKRSVKRKRIKSKTKSRLTGKH